MKAAIRLIAVFSILAAVASAQSGIKRYSGKVREFVWQNPKVYVVFDIKQSDGTVDTYRLICGSPSEAIRLGLRQNSVKQGDTLVVEVNEDQSSRNFGQTLATLPDGRKVRDCMLQ